MPQAADRNQVDRPRVVAALFLGALALRPQLAGVGPLLPDIQQELGLTHAVAGLLTAIPIVCMGLFALPAARAFAALGARASVALALGLVVLGGATRAMSSDIVSLLGLTIVLGIGAGLAGALFPAVVRQSAAGTPGLATGAYSVGINGSAGIAGLLAAPLALLTGSWRGALAVFSLAAVASLVAWLMLTRGPVLMRQPRTVPARLPWRSRTAWWLVILFGLQGACFHGLNAWLADVAVEHGWSVVSAGGLVGMLNFITIPATLLVAAYGDRVSRRAYLVVSASLLCVSLCGLALAPAAAWLWAAGAGIACGSLFPLAMTLAVDFARSAGEAGALAGLMLGGGYLVSGLAPVVLGAIRDATGGFGAALWLLAALAVLLIIACTISAPHRPDDMEARLSDG